MELLDEDKFPGLKDVLLSAVGELQRSERLKEAAVYLAQDALRNIIDTGMANTVLGLAGIPLEVEEMQHS
jgi:hypothetical protein